MLFTLKNFYWIIFLVIFFPISLIPSGFPSFRCWISYDLLLCFPIFHLCLFALLLGNLPNFIITQLFILSTFCWVSTMDKAIFKVLEILVRKKNSCHYWSYSLWTLLLSCWFLLQNFKFPRIICDLSVPSSNVLFCFLAI